MLVLAVVSFLGVSLGMSSGILLALWSSCSSWRFLILWSVTARWWEIEQSMRNLRVFFLHLFLEKMSACWMTASSRRPSPSPFHRRHCQAVGYDAACQDTSRWCSAGGGELPVRDFHSLCPPKKLPHLPSLLGQVCGVENPGKVNLKEFYGTSAQQGSCWCAAEEGDCVSWLAVPTLLRKIFNFQAHWYT